MSTGRIYAFITCTRTKWDQDDEGFPIEDAVEEHGWIDRQWSLGTLHDSRNDVRPTVDVDDDDDPEVIFEEITDALEWLDDGFEDNGNGTFYASGNYTPWDDEWEYHYALHFTRKSIHPLLGWTEVAFDPMTIPSVKEWADSKAWAHRH